MLSEQAYRKLVRKAQKTKQPLSLISSENLCLQLALASGIVAEVQQSWATLLDDERLEWAYTLWAQNMREMYARSSWGFNEKEKRRELCMPEGRYVLMHVDKRPIAYAYFRFDMDAGDGVVYLYELQVEKEFQKQGVGTYLMHLMEQLAKAAKLRKVLLTTFKFNEAAQNFFREKLNYELDETDENAEDYDILCKIVN